MDSTVTSDEVAPVAAMVVDSSVVASGDVAPVTAAVDSLVPSGDVAPTVAVDSSVVASGDVAPMMKRHSKQDAIDALFGKPVVQAPATPETSAVIPFASTPVKKQNLKQVEIGAFLKDQSAPVAVDTSAPSGSAAPIGTVDSVSSGNAAPGFLVLSRRGSDEGEGLWMLDLALFRGSYP